MKLNALKLITSDFIDDYNRIKGNDGVPSIEEIKEFLSEFDPEDDCLDDLILRLIPNSDKGDSMIDDIMDGNLPNGTVLEKEDWYFELEIC